MHSGTKAKPSPTGEERLAAKAAKREKQRAENASRAEVMRRARVASDLPNSVPPIVPPLINVGCSGWFYWHWRGIFYPERLKTKDWFKHYRKTFSSVELNAPFYSWPTVSSVQQWQKQAPDPNFIYTVKVCELITHVKRFQRTKTLIKDFNYIGDLLGAQMGCFLLQLPPSYAYSVARLNAIASQLDPTRRNVVEFRHRSWWNQQVYDAFEKAGIIFCSCSGPRLPDQLVTTATDVYIRFHGVTKWYRHDYTEPELARWVRLIEESGCQRVWAYFNNDRDGFAVKNGKEFRRQLQGTRLCLQAHRSSH